MAENNEKQVSLAENSQQKQKARPRRRRPASKKTPEQQEKNQVQPQAVQGTPQKAAAPGRAQKRAPAVPGRQQVQKSTAHGQNPAEASAATGGHKPAGQKAQPSGQREKRTGEEQRPAQPAKKQPEQRNGQPAAKRKQLASRNQNGEKNTARPKLRVIPLGGLNEIGKNMTVLEYGDDIIVVDCGMTFPDDEQLGVDLVIPDTTYLQRNLNKVRGIFITHGHEDHIGALPYVLRDVNVPVHCTALTAGIVGIKLKEHPNLKKVKMRVHKDGERVKAGCFEVEFIHVNHSIADACAFAIKTPVGTVVFTGDFKIDTTPIDGEVINLERFGQLGREGVLLLCCDSTNAERPGIAMSERKVGNSFEREFKNCDKRIIIASFASNVHRIQEIIDVAVRYGRKVAVSGRSMENILKVGTELGYIQPPAGTMVDLKEIRKYSADRLVIITTGSQGEPMSALYRMAFSGHRQVEVGYGDKILIAASPIPGNEKSVYSMINELFRKGAEVVYERLADMHVLGHACQEELKMIMALTRPKYFMPVHGEYRHLKVNSNLAKDCGVKAENIFLSDVGRVLELDEKGAGFSGTVPSGRVLVDGYGVGDVGNAVLRERKNLSESGVITIAAAVDMKNATIVSAPEITSRGFIFVREAEGMMEELRTIAWETLQACLEKGMTSRSNIKEAMTRKLSDYLYRKTKREPLILPILIEV